VYDFLMTFSLKKLVWRHKKILSNVIDMQKAMKAKSVCEFDRQVSMKMHGYENLEDYWKKNNPMRDVFNIKRPLLCLNALDDPVCTKEQIPYQEIAQMNHVMLIETGSGSHCAFYQGHLKLKSWAPEVAMTYLDSVREYQTQTKKNKISSSPSTQALSA
jgi:predicted alpha/beta-fold hydrolase